MKHERVVASQASFDRLSLAAFTITATLLLLIPINQDSIWQVWVGRHALHGARLYVDILDPDPPLLYWLAMVEGAIAQLVGARVAVIVFCTSLMGASVYLTPRAYRLPALAAMIVPSLGAFGKPEHFAIIGTIAYALLIAARSHGEEVRHPWAVGFLAALGFAMKPTFIFVPVVLEFFVRRYPRVRPETAALAISAVAYCAAVVIFAPAFLRSIPMLVAAYGAFKGTTYPFMSAVALLLFVLGFATRQRSSVGVILAAVALAFIPAVLIEAKWWDYQTLPMRAFLFFVIITEITKARGRPFSDALLVASGILCLYPFGPYRNSFRQQMEQHLQGVAPGSSIAVLAVDPGLAWPIVEDRHLDWRLRESCLWQLPASSHDPVVAAQLKQLINDDLARRPEVLVFDRHPLVEPIVKSMLPTGYLAAYRLQRRTGRIESYRLISAKDAVTSPLRPLGPEAA